MRRRKLLQGAAYLALFTVPVSGLIDTSEARVPHSGGSAGTSNTLTLVTMEAGIIGQSTPVTGFGPFAMGGYGRYTGTAPTTATGTWSGCGGGAATNVVLTADIYETGTYLVNVDAPGTAGTGCRLTITTNLGTTATSPPTIVTNFTTGSEVVSNIHNAPGWRKSHSYAPATGPKTRVVNGAGWTPGTATYTPGAALNAYELTSRSSCTSAASGGPSGTGSSIGDGTCTWKYLSGVDYITASAYALDAPAWVSGTSYMFGQGITTPSAGGILQSFSLIGIGAHPGYSFCTSTVSPPLGSWTGNVITTSDGCLWVYQGDIAYSSQASYIPWKTYANYPNNASTTHVTRDYRALLWNDREYVAGSKGETNPIGSYGHTRGGGYGLESNQNDCVTGICHYITFTPAAGESFRDSLTTSSPLSGYDPTKGVAFRNPNASGGSEPAAFFVGDHYVRVNGIQFQSAHAAGLFTWNNEQITNNIIDGGWSNGGSTYGAAVVGDVFLVLSGNLIISHGPMGFMFKYGNTFILYNTFINVGHVSNATAVAFAWAWVMQAPVMSNNAIYGFPHVGSYLTAEPVQVFDSSSSHNITDTASGDSGTAPWIQGNATASMVITVAGTTYSTTGANMFVSPGTDFRPGTALVGAGGSYGNFNWNCQHPTVEGCPVVLNEDTPDIIGTARPRAGSWTVGAEQKP